MAKKKEATASAPAPEASNGDATKETRATRQRTIVREYNYDEGSGNLKDANSGLGLVTVDVSAFPDAVIRKLALGKAMDLIASAGTEAARENGDPKDAMGEVIADLIADSVEFREGAGIAMGGTLKRIGRALVELGKSYVKSPDGQVFVWDTGAAQAAGVTGTNTGDGINGAFAAMKALWDVKGNKDTKAPSGRQVVMFIKDLPDVKAKLDSYSKAAPKAALSVELG